MKLILALLLMAGGLVGLRPSWAGTESDVMPDASVRTVSVQNGLTVRVDTSTSAPRLAVNGRPVRARVFFGGPGSAPLKVEPAGGRIEFEFIAQNNSQGAGTLHFRFGQLPGDIYLDNIRVIDADSGAEILPSSDFETGSSAFSRDWRSWPGDSANTVATVAVEPSAGAEQSAGLHIHLHEPATGSWPDWHIYHHPNLGILEGHRYRVTFWARAEPARELTVALYRPGAAFVYLGGPNGPFPSQIKMAAGVGVNVISFPIATPWPQLGESAEWAAVDNVCAEVLRANPNALLLPRFGADPPDWWRRAYPADTMTWEDGSQQSHGVVASPRYRREAAERVAALVEHLESKFGPHMAGYHPCGQNTGEWFYQDTWGNRLNGYAGADTVAWRTWLQAKYGSDTALQAAWHKLAVTLADVAVPSPAQRRSSANGSLRDPAAEKVLIDFAQFQQESMADLVCELARAVRQASAGRKLVAFFYGYLFEFGSIRLGPATSGHYALRRVLDSPDIDVLCSPISYFDRGLGGSAPAMTAAESVALAGKMWLVEDDTRTYLGSGNFPGKEEGARDLAETLTMLRRNVAEEATRNFATWWMDLGMTGWFDDPRLWDEMRRLEPIDRTFVDHPTPYRPEVAAVLDERSMLETSANAWIVTEPGIYQVRRPLGRMGTPYGQYLLDDVIHGRVRARLYVFLNPWQLSAGERQALRTNTQEACSIWCYAPGLHDGDHTSPEAMQELTGFRLVPISSAKAWATPTALGRQLGLQSGFGVDGPVSPLFAAADVAESEILARYPDGAAAVTLRQTATGCSLFVGPPGLSSDLLRLAARKAKVHLYTETDCNVFGNGPILALHGAQDGLVTVNLGRSGPVADALSGESLGTGPSFPLSLRKGETRVIRY